MYIRKRSFFEIIYPLTIVFFACVTTSFIGDIHGAVLRWVLVIFLSFYLFLNKKILTYQSHFFAVILVGYLTWCMSTTLWSEVPILSLSKSVLFSFNVIMMLSAGSLWVVKYGYEHAFNWFFLTLIIALLSGLLGGGGSVSSFSLYSGLSGNSNTYGFMVAIVSPLIFLRLYENKANRKPFIFWLIILLMDFHFLIKSYSRGSIAIFMCILAFFALSLPLSKKILITILVFFLIMVTLIMTPVSYIEDMVASHILKRSSSDINLESGSNSGVMLSSRQKVWDKSYKQAQKGGIMGGGFAVTIGDRNFNAKNLSGAGYGREKGNSQLEIVEETGLIGLFFYAMILISFFAYSVPYYFRLKGSEKVTMGIALGAIVGLLLESIVEGWWDSPAGQEPICFWSLVGVVFGMIYLHRKKCGQRSGK